MTTPIPSKIGKYDVTGVIGRGGMGVVYLATDPHLDRRVAIKMIIGSFSENPDMLKRFFREAQSLGSLQHPNIVTVFDLGDYGGNPYFVMEYLEGEGLDSLISNRQLNLLEKISIMIQVCTGLAYAHRRGVIHRDIKPANIMISKDGGVKIFDFGIAHAGQTNVTRTGEVIGTLRYMAPEQINSKSVDSRTDIFSTGVVLYQLITDHLPFDGDNTASTLMKIVNEAPPPLGNFLTAYPPEMEEILLKALAKNPNERYSTADEFAMDLAQLQGQLKEELIGKEMQEVALLIDQGDVYRAQSSLQRVLKIDRQHTRANRLLREVQQRIQRDELGKQVQGLRERAEQALADQQFDQAMEHLDRALGLDRDNFDLMQLRETIREAAARAEKLHNALKAAEAAQADGKLETAKEAVEAALAVAPNDTQARTLYRLISREMEERARQQQVEGYLLEARQELSSRKFTAALVILKQAEQLDPVSPQVHSLMESAVAGQEQERRRRELEALTREVEEALNRDDYRAACEKTDEGLAKFPDDRNLLKLKGMADRQRLVEERRQFVDQLLAEARLLLQAGRNEELQTRLETALSQIGAEPRLQSLLAAVVEKLARERMEQQRSQRLEQARQSLSNQAYDEAIQTLDAQAREMGDDPEVQDLQATIQERKREEAIASALNAVKRQQGAGDLQGALREVGEAISSYPDERRLRDLQAQLEERVQQAREAARLAEIQQRKEAFVQDALRRAQQAVVLDQRVQILEEALRTEPQEIRLQQQLSAARDLRLNTLQSQRPLAPPDSLTTKSPQGLRDTTPSGKGQSIETIPPVIEPGLGSDELQQATLPIVERHLAAFIGPLAKVLVKRAAAKITSVQELYSILGSGLEREADRKAFLAKRSELAGGKANAVFSKLATPPVGPPVATPLDVLPPGEITPAAVEKAARTLAAHLGPIAPVLARKEAKRAANLREFYELLAQHVVNPADRERFLKESGISKEAVPSNLLTRLNETVSFKAQAANPDSTTRQFKPERKGE